MSTFTSKYNVIGQIGEGSFSIVLKCIDKDSGEHYAAKRLKKTFTQLDDVLDSAEVIATKILTKHPNILQMLEYYYSPSSGNLIFIFELMDMSMYEYLMKRRRVMHENRVKNYLYQILKGIEHLHANGLFHRDIKPENILMKLLNDNQYHIIKLADFGSIRGIYSEHPYTDYISTRWYRSPECLLTIGQYGPKMDIWAAGCVFYEMLTLKPLFPGTNEIDQLAKIHKILGTPNKRTLVKFKEKSSNFDFFTPIQGIGLKLLLPSGTEEAIKLLKVMLVYDPDHRTNIRRLLDQKYFAILRQNDICLKMNAPYMENTNSFKCSGDFHSSFIKKKSQQNTFKSKSCLQNNQYYILKECMFYNKEKTTKFEELKTNSNTQTTKLNFELNAFPKHNNTICKSDMKKSMQLKLDKTLHDKKNTFTSKTTGSLMKNMPSFDKRVYSSREQNYLNVILNDIHHRCLKRKLAS